MTEPTTTTTSTTSSSNNKVRIHPMILAVILGLIVNFFRARWKAFHRNTTAATAGNSHRNSKGHEALFLRDYSFDQIIQTDPQDTDESVSEEERLRLQKIQSSLNKAQTGSGTQIYSHFLTDRKVLEKLNNHSLWQECMIMNENKAQTALLWMDINAKPQNIWEELAVQIWQNHPLIQQEQQQYGSNKHMIAGYEYWCNILTPDFNLDWHVDKDEIAWNANTKAKANDNDWKDRLKTPYMGAVYYGYPHTFTGGYLELFPYHPSQVPDPNPFTSATSGNSKTQQTYGGIVTERIQAEYNRMIYLNVSEWHRVTPISSGARYTLAVNIWKERPKGV